jgi:hypothetical protein
MKDERMALEDEEGFFSVFSSSACLLTFHACHKRVFWGTKAARSLNKNCSRRLTNSGTIIGCPLHSRIRRETPVAKKDTAVPFSRRRAPWLFFSLIERGAALSGSSETSKTSTFLFR